MRTIVKGRNLDVAELDRRYAQQKMGRLGRLLDDRTDALVELAHEAHRNQDDVRIVEVTLVVDGRPIRGVARAATWRAAIDQVVDKLERQAVELKERPIDRARATDRRRRAAVPAGAATDTDATGAGERRVVKVKRFAIEPMFEEDAIVRMEELGHSFFIFVNAENERVAVLYRRTDGDYGLIEPAMGGAYTTNRSGVNQTRPRPPAHGQSRSPSRGVP
jgi:putative sigma-54 modulation protein